MCGSADHTADALRQRHRSGGSRRGVRSGAVWGSPVWGITCRVTLPSTSVEPMLPRAIGPLSSAVIDSLQRGKAGAARTSDRHAGL